jgi:hypothetical protein
MHIPYVYKLIEIESGKSYIGCRYSIDCYPEDLGVKYFTSSDIVAPLFKSNPNAFSKEILFTGTVKEVRDLERKLLVEFNVVVNDNWFNKTDMIGISIENCIKGGLIRGSEQGKKCRDEKTGMFALSEEEKKRIATDAANKTVKLCVGVHARTREQRVTDGRKGGLIGGKKGGESAKLSGQIYTISAVGGRVGGKVSAKQKYQCLECGMITGAGTLGKHQKSKNHKGRIRVK